MALLRERLMSLQAKVDQYLRENPDLLSQVIRKKRTARESIRNGNWSQPVLLHGRAKLARVEEDNGEPEDEEQEAANALLAMAQPTAREPSPTPSRPLSKQKRAQKSQPGSWKSSQSSARRRPRGRPATSESEGSQGGSQNVTVFPLPTDRCPPLHAEPSGLSMHSFGRHGLQANASGFSAQNSQITRPPAVQYRLCQSSQPGSNSAPPEKLPQRGRGVPGPKPADLRYPDSNAFSAATHSKRSTQRQGLSSLVAPYDTGLSSENEYPGLAQFPVTAKLEHLEFQQTGSDRENQEGDGRESSGLGLDRGMSCPEPRSAQSQHRLPQIGSAPLASARHPDWQGNEHSNRRGPALNRPTQTIRLQLAPASSQELILSPPVEIPGLKSRLNARGGNLTILPGQSVDLGQTFHQLQKRPSIDTPDLSQGLSRGRTPSQNISDCEQENGMPAIKPSNSQMSLPLMTSRHNSPHPSGQSPYLQGNGNKQGPWGLTVFSALNPCVVTTGHHPTRE